MTRPVLLRGGLVADGAGPVTVPADVLIRDGRIAAVTARAPSDSSGRIDPGEGSGPAPDVDVIEVPDGSVVCPGFIDAHVHAEGPLLDHGQVGGALAQGVTTLVVGQDGQSWIGAGPAALAYLNRYFAPVNGTLGEPLSVAGYRAAVSGRLRQNVAVLASQGTIRYNVAGLDRGPLDPGQVAAARREVEESLAAGAAGLSSGLDYLPSRYGESAEVAALAAPLAAADRPYVSHLRGYGPNVAAGLAELTEVGARAGIRVHASHLWGPPSMIVPALDAAVARGVRLTFDSYPYRRSSSILAMTLLPPEFQAGGPDHTVAALSDPDQRAALAATLRESGLLTDHRLSQLYLGTLPAPLAPLAGLSITDAALASGQPAGEWILGLLARTDLNIGAHVDRPSLTEEHLAWLARHDLQCAGSDGIYQGQHPHPRGYGAFAHLAAYYLEPRSPGDATGPATAGPVTGGLATDDPVTGGPAPGGPAPGGPAPAGSGARRPFVLKASTDPYQRLARHLATRAADVFGLRDRGRILPGLAADLVVIAPGGLAEQATYAAPRRPATGVTLVLVNGTVVYRDGTPTQTADPGQMLS